MQRGWYYRVSGRECGPVSFERLAELVRHRRLLPADEILKGPTGDWTKVGDCEDFVRWIENCPSGPIDDSSSVAPSPSSPQIADQPQQPAAMRAWFCKIREDELGPFNASELQRMLAEGKLIPLDLVRRGTAGGWKEYFQWERQIAADAAVEPAAAKRTAAPPAKDSANVSRSSETSPLSSDALEPAGGMHTPGAAKHLPTRPRRVVQANRARGERIREIAREHWPLAAAGALLLAANLFALMPRTDPNWERHRAFSELLSRVQTLQNQNAPPEAWEQVSDEVRARIQPMIDSLKQNSDVQHPIEQHLLWAGRDYLLPLVEDYRRESLDPKRNPRAETSEAAARERSFHKHMNEAARLFDHER